MRKLKRRVRLSRELLALREEPGPPYFAWFMLAWAAALLVQVVWLVVR